MTSDRPTCRDAEKIRILLLSTGVVQQESVRKRFELEALEPRLLLSGDGLLLPAADAEALRGPQVALELNEASLQIAHDAAAETVLGGKLDRRIRHAEEGYHAPA